MKNGSPWIYLINYLKVYVKSCAFFFNKLLYLFIVLYILVLKVVNLRSLFYYSIFKLFFFYYFYIPCVFRTLIFCIFIVICIVWLLMVSKFVKIIVFLLVSLFSLFPVSLKYDEFDVFKNLLYCSLLLFVHITKILNTLCIFIVIILLSILESINIWDLIEPA